MRINKYLADSGVASRREADTLIEKGQVLVNGKKAVVGQKVEADDEVRLVGNTRKKDYLAYYKGRGIISHSPGEDEVDIATRLERDYKIRHVAPIGRLDKDSEGLIILSSDGRITGPLLDPDSGIEKEYDVTVDKPLAPVFARIMGAGVDIEGYRTKPAVITPSKSNPKRFTIVLTEGKKHQIRRMCAALGYQVQTLKRTRIATVSLGKLKPNQFRKLQGEELQTFLSHLGVT
jgi:23S rRNA pseudouridine2604 synthase